MITPSRLAGFKPESEITSSPLAGFGSFRPRGGRIGILADFRYLLTVSRRTPVSFSIRRTAYPIRALVLIRKVVFGTRSDRGTQVHAQFMSTSQTARKQGIDHGYFIIQALAAHLADKPPPSIFNS